MRRTLAVLLSALLLLCTLPVAVSADPAAINPTIEAVLDGGKNLTLTWDAATTEGYTATEVKIDGKTHSLQSNQAGKATATLALSPKVYTGKCVFKDEENNNVEVDFTLNTFTGVGLTLTPTLKTDTVEVSVVDDNTRRPIKGLTLYLKVDGAEKESVDTNGSSSKFSFSTVISGRPTIEVYTKAQKVESADGYSVTYKATSAKYEYPKETLNFNFKENARTFNGNTGELKVEWNAEKADGTVLAAVMVNGQRHTVNDTSGRFTVKVGNLAPANHPITYVFRLASGTEVTEKAADLEWEGNVKTILKLDVENNRIVATLTDSYGNPLKGYPLTLKVATTSLKDETDQNGRVVFNVMPPEDRRTVSCIAENRQDGKITYTGTTASLAPSTIVTGTPDTQKPTNAPQTQPPRTNPTVNVPTAVTPGTNPPTTAGTQATYPVIRGAGTTAIQNDLIALNVTYDEGILRQFGMQQADFSDRARLLVSQELYNSLVGGSKSTIMLSARYSAIQVTDQHISAAISGKSAFSTFDASETERLTIDLGLLLAEANASDVMLPLSPAGDYIIQFPVPASMQDSPVIGVALTNENGLVELTEAKVENGNLTFTVKQIATITLLGFPKDGDGGNGGSVPTLVIILLVVGVLMLVGAGLLLYFFVIRKPKDDDDDDFPPEGPDGFDPENPDGGPEGPDGYDPQQPDGQAPYSDERDLYHTDTGDIYSSDARRRAADLQYDSRDIYSTGSREPGHAAPADTDSRDIYSSDSRRVGGADDRDIYSGVERPLTPRQPKPVVPPRSAGSAPLNPNPPRKNTSSDPRKPKH